MNEIAVIRHAAADVDAYRASTEAANICKEIVVACSSTIQGRRFVSVEGWSAIAVAHGCVLSARDVEKIDGGVRAVGDVRRMSDGQLIATGEGFVGEDETTWFGGKDKRGKVHDKRNDYAIRAMAQTRAMSRAGRTAFAHVVVMMKAGLATTPAEEMAAIDGETGEVFEHGGPAPRTKLEGPYTSKTALKNAIHTVAGSVGKAKSVDEIDAAVKAGKDAIKQAERDWPELLTGDPSLEGDDEGLKRMCARRRAELTPRHESTGFQLISSLVKECATADDLGSLLDEYATVISELDGEESRRFDEIYNAREDALREAKSPTPLVAGAFGG